MTKQQWNDFCDFKTNFKVQIEKWSQNGEELKRLQKEAANIAGTPEYPFETPVVYNRALDEITENDEIKIIVIGDNPGKDEQLLKNNKYLVGQAGKIGEGFFRKNPSLGIDFRKNAIILNKTPIHSAKTAQLKTMMKSGGAEIVETIEESQLWMAQKTAELAKALGAQIWLVGYSELKEKGIFLNYRNELKSSCKTLEIWNQLFVFQHFSMNRFSIDLKAFMSENPGLTLENAVLELGKIHRKEIFGE